MSPRVFRIAPLLFGSGMCALIYQVAWLRELRMIFGASTAASAAVLAVFMGGLGAGGLILGKRADRHPEPLMLYANLELGVAASAGLTPLLVVAARWVYGQLGGTVVLGLTGGSIARLVLAAVILGAPTLLMGGTLPAAARAAVGQGDTARRDLAMLYGVNTLGAVTGAVATNFVLLEVFGSRLSLWMACLINMLVAVVARGVARGLETASDRSSEAAREPAAVQADAPAAEPAGLTPPFTLLAAGVAGFAFLLMELVWYRMLSPILGGSSYTFGLILAVALLGIGIGGSGYAAFGRNRPATLVGFSLTCVLEALCIAFPYALGDRLAVLALLLRPLGAIGFSGHVAAWTVVTSIVVLPAAIVAGWQFPLLIALLGRGKSDVGRHVGHAYAANTAGAILGSLAGGFGLLPVLSAPGCWRAVVAVLVGLGLGTLATGIARERARWNLAWPAAVAICAVALIAARGPTGAFRHSPIGAGRAEIDIADADYNSIEAWLHVQRSAVYWEQDGVESSVALLGRNGYAFAVNGKSDGSARQDAPTQVMSGLIGAILHGSPKSALVIGLGTGSTAGWLAEVPSMQKVFVVEIEPAIVRVARDCTPVNRNVLDNPKVSVFIGDAREVLLTTPERYDIIFSEPSNPYRAGVSSLYTQEFYAGAVQRLAEGGLFIQWMQAYETNSESVQLVYSTLSSVFGSVETWTTEPGDIIFLASNSPLEHDAATLRARIAEEPYRTALSNVFRANDLEGFFAHYVARPSLARTIAEQELNFVNTDDMNHLEFRFARNVGRRAVFSVGQISDMAVHRGEDRPEITGELDWKLWEERRATIFSYGPVAQRPVLRGKVGPDAEKRLEAISRFIVRDYAGAAAAWRAQPGAARTPLEMDVVAGSLAETKDEGAPAAIEALRAVCAPDADIYTARFRLRSGDVAGAAEALQAAFAGYRHDAWGSTPVLFLALQTAPEIATLDPQLGERLFEALREPFPLRLLEAERKRARMRLASRTAFPRLCLEAVTAFEPHVPWQLQFLRRREDCYRMHSHPLLADASRDVADYAAHADQAFFIGGPSPVQRAQDTDPSPQDLSGALGDDSRGQIAEPKRDGGPE